MAIKYLRGVSATWKDTTTSSFFLIGLTPKTLSCLSTWVCSCYTRDYLSDDEVDDYDDLHPDWDSLNDGNLNLKESLQYWWDFGAFDTPLSWRLLSDDKFGMAHASIDLFSFAETYNIPRLRQDCLDRLCWYYSELSIGSKRSGPEPMTHFKDLVRHAYDTTTPGSPIRRIVVDGFLILPIASTPAEQLPVQFLTDVVNAYQQPLPLRGGRLFGCDYHDHESHEESKACRIRVEYSYGRTWNPDTSWKNL